MPGLGHGHHIEVVAYAADNAQSTGDVLTYAPTMPGKVKRFGFIVTEAFSATDNLILALDLRPTLKDDTNRAEKATLTIASGNSAAADPGDLYYREFEQAVAVGQEVVLDLTNAVAAGAAQYFIHYEPYAFQPNAGATGWPASGNVVKATS